MKTYIVTLCRDPQCRYLVVADHHHIEEGALALYADGGEIGDEEAVFPRGEWMCFLRSSESAIELSEAFKLTNFTIPVAKK